ncbi:hypothetical protein GCM10011317_16060 [Niveispirillum cyanobacteriorum]|nr:hypothetical protein GCM10011317_16060 [Niveispirillum cyanobacteriorum]
MGKGGEIGITARTRRFMPMFQSDGGALRIAKAGKGFLIEHRVSTGLSQTDRRGGGPDCPPTLVQVKLPVTPGATRRRTEIDAASYCPYPA